MLQPDPSQYAAHAFAAAEDLGFAPARLLHLIHC